MMRKVDPHDQISYQPKCGRLKLSHLVFADDLMIFVRGDGRCVLAIKHTVDTFGQISGLVANVDKTEIYFGGIGDHIQ